MAVTGEVAGADAPTLWGAQTCKTPSPHEGHPLQAPQSWQDHHQGWKSALVVQLLLWPVGGWRASVLSRVKGAADGAAALLC